MTALPDHETLVQITEPGVEREEFLAARSQGLGSSDIAALLGADKYRTALGVYLDKTVTRPPDEDDDDGLPDARYWGTVLEAPVAEHFARANGVHLLQAGTWARNDWQLASPDRLIFTTTPDLNQYDSAPGVLGNVAGGYEGKTASAYPSDEWSHNLVPDRYQLQCYWQMHVLGLSHVWIAALIGGQQYVQVRIDRDQEFIDGIVSIAARFWWDNVQSQVPPSLVGEPVRAALELVKELNPVSLEGTRMDAPPEFGDWVRSREYHKAMAKAHETAAGAYEVAIRQAAGDAETIYVDGEKVLKLTQIDGKEITRNTYYRKPSRRLYPAKALKVEEPVLDLEPSIAKEITAS